MALVEGCKHELEFLIPAQEVEEETKKVAEQYQKKAHLKGFRAGKAPLSLIRTFYKAEVSQKVQDAIVNRHLWARVKEENLNVVSQPTLKEGHLHDGADFHFKVEFEVFPTFELGEYKGVEVPWVEPEVAEEDVDKRLEEIRDSKATYANVDARPLESGDYAVISLESIAGTDEPIKSDEVQVLIGGPETMAGFTENLTGASPGDVKEIDVTYPEDYGSPKLAGKAVKFSVTVTGLRRKELPELNDDFAKDLGDFRNFEELRAEVKKDLFKRRQAELVRAAKDKIVDKLVDLNEFPVPVAMVERRIQDGVRQRLRELEQEGVDPRSFQLDWDKIREAQSAQATRGVRASMILGRVSELEGIGATQDEIDIQVEGIARQQREMVAVVRKKLQEDGAIEHIRADIQAQKTLQFLFENATKTAE